MNVVLFIVNVIMDVDLKMPRNSKEFLNQNKKRELGVRRVIVMEVVNEF
jgi:hypothetical protein